MPKSRYHNNLGFTLIELLVAVVILGVLMTAIMQIFIKSQVIYNVQEEVAAMQQNVRTAKLFLERDARMAGSGVMNLQGPNKKPILPLSFKNDNGPGGTDELTVLFELPVANPCGTTLTAPATMFCNELPTLSLAGSVNDSSTVADINEDLDAAPYSAWDSDTCSCNGTVYDLSSDSFPFIVSTPDRRLNSILIATGTNTGGGTDKIANGPNVAYGSIPGNDELYDFIGELTTVTLENKQLNTYPAGSLIRFFTPGGMYRATYYVATDATSGISSLYRDLNDGSGGEIIAEDIEDFQCAFIMEDGTEINDRDLLDAEIADVRMIRINVLGRTAHEHTQRGGEFTGNRPAIEDNPAGPTDNFRRRQLTVTVKVRNFSL